MNALHNEISKSEENSSSASPTLAGLEALSFGLSFLPDGKQDNCLSLGRLHPYHTGLEKHLILTPGHQQQTYFLFLDLSATQDNTQLLKQKCFGSVSPPARDWSAAAYPGGG